MTDISIVQRMYDLIQWYVPILNRLPKDQKFTLGQRMTHGMYEIFEGLIKAKYSRKKLPLL